jgi:hypothetical protein
MPASLASLFIWHQTFSFQEITWLREAASKFQALNRCEQSVSMMMLAETMAESQYAGSGTRLARLVEVAMSGIG